MAASRSRDALPLCRHGARRHHHAGLVAVLAEERDAHLAGHAVAAVERAAVVDGPEAPRIHLAAHATIGEHQRLVVVRQRVADLADVGRDQERHRHVVADVAARAAAEHLVLGSVLAAVAALDRHGRDGTRDRDTADDPGTEELRCRRLSCLEHRGKRGEGDQFPAHHCPDESKELHWCLMNSLWHHACHRCRPLALVAQASRLTLLQKFVQMIKV
jgi:hypothetical protein